MALPPDLSTREVVGTYVDYSGNPVNGTITFTSTARLVVDTDDSVVIPSTITGYLVDGLLKGNADGTQPLLLPVTDDPDASPSNFTYSVQEQFTGSYKGIAFNLAVPTNVEPLDLPSQSPSAPPVNPGVQPVTQINGENPNAQGAITLSASDVGAAPTVHTHTIAQVDSLQTALDAKASSSSLAAVAVTGAYGDLSGAPTIPSVTDVPRYVVWDGAAWPARGTSPRATLFIGGSYPADAPTDPNKLPIDRWLPGA